MNWDQLEGKWKQYKGQIQIKWGKLTDDDIHIIAGQRDQFIGRLQERYGIAKEAAAKQVDEFVRALAEDSGDRVTEMPSSESKAARRAAGRN